MSAKRKQDDDIENSQEKRLKPLWDNTKLPSNFWVQLRRWVLDPQAAAICQCVCKEWRVIFAQPVHDRDRRLRFDEAQHRYFIDGERDPRLISVTTLIHHFFEPFHESAVIAGMRARDNWKKNKYYGLTDDQIKLLWKENGQGASGKGTKMHAHLEHLFHDRIAGVSSPELEHVKLDELLYVSQEEEREAEWIMQQLAGFSKWETGAKRDLERTGNEVKYEEELQQQIHRRFGNSFPMTESRWLEWITEFLETHSKSSRQERAHQLQQHFTTREPQWVERMCRQMDEFFEWQTEAMEKKNAQFNEERQKQIQHRFGDTFPMRESHRLDRLEQPIIEREHLQSFLEDHLHLIPFRMEWPLFDKELLVCGTIDALFIDPTAAEGHYGGNPEDCIDCYDIAVGEHKSLCLVLAMFDWKRSKEIKSFNPHSKGKKGTPLEDYDDCNFIHYSLQLHIYSYLLAKHYGVHVKSMHLIVFHPNHGNYIKVECKDMSQVAKEIFEYRRKQLESGKENNHENDSSHHDDNI